MSSKLPWTGYPFGQFEIDNQTIKICFKNKIVDLNACLEFLYIYFFLEAYSDFPLIIFFKNFFI